MTSYLSIMVMDHFTKEMVLNKDTHTQMIYSPHRLNEVDKPGSDSFCFFNCWILDRTPGLRNMPTASVPTFRKYRMAYSIVWGKGWPDCLKFCRRGTPKMFLSLYNSWLFPRFLNLGTILKLNESYRKLAILQKWTKADHYGNIYAEMRPKLTPYLKIFSTSHEVGWKMRQLEQTMHLKKYVAS